MNRDLPALHYFDQNHLVIGQLFSGTQPTYPPCNEQTGGNNYGRFDLSWDGGGTNDTRLSNWLDPSNSNAFVTNTTNVANLTSYEISGDDNFCTTSNPYTVNNLPSGATVTWSVSQSGIVSLNANGNSVTATRITDGTFVLIATIDNNGCIITASKLVKVGSYLPYITLYGPTNVSCGEIVRYFTADLQGVSYQWSYPASWIYIAGQYTSSIGFQIPYYPYSPTSGDVSVTVQDACNSNTITVYVNSSCGGYYYSMSPNPAASTVTVSAKETTAQGEKSDKAITEINIYEQQGNLKKHEKFSKTKTATVNISGLNNGVYFVEIVDGNFKERQKLIIQK